MYYQAKKRFDPDPLATAVDQAFKAVVDAEEYIYAAGIQDCKQDIISAHSALLSVRNKLAAARRIRESRAKEAADTK